MGKLTLHVKVFIFIVIFLLMDFSLFAQTPIDSTGAKFRGKSSTPAFVDSSSNKTLVTADTAVADTLNGKKIKIKHDYKNHSPKKATWMSAALPSLGQFYNRRYWKPPIIYVGLGVAAYFLIDNQLKFIIARNSYRARLNVPGYTVASKYSNLSADQILADRDFYRTNRDYSIIGLSAVYVLNIIDAAVDAHLRSFDVSDDLSMKVKPSFQYSSMTMQNGFAPMPGIAWSIRF